MKIQRKIIQIDDELCDGCGQCVPACAEGTLEIVDGKARVISDNLCDGLGACLGECPRGALTIVEREADEFDEAAVERRLAASDAAQGECAVGARPEFQGCPSAGVKLFVPPGRGPAPDHGAAGGGSSALSHWPIQIRLVPPDAPFLKGADLLVLADCAAVSCADLHDDYLAGRVVMMGCPKFDDAPAYVEKFTRIFTESGIHSITVLFMEVPCCGALPMIVKKALAAAKTDIPVEEVIVGCRGQIVETPLRRLA